jgi:hypothetical protein
MKSGESGVMHPDMHVHLCHAGYEDEAEFEDALNGPFSDFLTV